MKYFIVAGLLLALAIINNSFAEMEEQMKALETKAARYAIVISRCLNEPVMITVAGEPAADCKPRKK